MRIKWLGVPLGLLVVFLVPGFAQDTPKRATRAEGESSVVTKVPPVYPPIAKQLKIQGNVELEAFVNTSGEVEKVSIVSGNPVLTKPAAEALKKWKFKPFVSDGQALGQLVPINISFKL